MALCGLASPFAADFRGAGAPIAALRYFSVFRISLVSIALLVPAVAAFFSAHFDGGAWYADLVSAHCFGAVPDDGSGGAIEFFEQRRLQLSSIKVALALVLLLHVGRAVVFYIACRYYPRFLKPKRAGAGSRGGDDLFAVPIDDDDNDLDDDDDLDTGGTDRASDIHRFPARATGAAPSRYDSDYESSDEDDYNDDSGDAARDRAASTRPVRIGGAGGAGELGSLGGGGGGGSEMAGGEMSVQRLMGSTSGSSSSSSSSSTRDVVDESQAAARLAAHASRNVTAADLDLFSVGGGSGSSSSASTGTAAATTASGGGSSLLRTTWGSATGAAAGANGGSSGRVPIADDLNMLWEDATVVVSRK